MTNPVQILTVNGKNIDGVLGIRIQDRTLVGAYEATELWWPTIIDCNQRNQIGQFSSVFGNKFCYKSSPNIWKTVWAFLKCITFKVKIVVSTFLATLSEIGLLLILPSGHTDCNLKFQSVYKVTFIRSLFQNICSPSFVGDFSRSIYCPYRKMSFRQFCLKSWTGTFSSSLLNVKCIHGS